MASSNQAFFSDDFFDFLKDLKRHNDRAWFAKNKGRFEKSVQESALSFIAAAGPKLRSISRHIVAEPKAFGGSLSRIYRDTRFSKDKTPYHTHIGIHFFHDGAGDDEAHRPGFFLHLEPTENGAYSGVLRPEAGALKAIREAIVRKSAEWKKATKSPVELWGESLKRPPPGFDPEHPLVEDLKRKDFVGLISFTPRQVTGAKFMDDFLEACRRMDPLNRFLAKAMNVAW
jgi:uncharacterized protein (TIGR02453 family)